MVVDSKSCKTKSPRNHSSKSVKGKEKASNLPHDSDFEDELPLSKRPHLNKEGKSSIVKSKVDRTLIVRKHTLLPVCLIGILIKERFIWIT